MGEKPQSIPLTQCLCKATSRLLPRATDPQGLTPGAGAAVVGLLSRKMAGPNLECLAAGEQGLSFPVSGQEPAWVVVAGSMGRAQMQGWESGETSPGESFPAAARVTGDLFYSFLLPFSLAASAYMALDTLGTNPSWAVCHTVCSAGHTGP